ncbi:MAG: hypothetical protein KAJ10_06810 [Thermodesulfovibrionia bacterium]|nr:hypothetical protein [Thermodesulfovibrionia bacterium]
MPHFISVALFHTRLICGLISILFLGGCGGISARSMIPDYKPTHNKTIDKTIRVLEVDHTIRGQWFSEKNYVNNKTFRDVLMTSLNQAQIFKSVHSGVNTDLDLKAHIIVHLFKKPARDIRNELIVRYTFINNKTGNIILEDIIHTEFGATGVNEACEGAVRENVKLFLQGIYERWPYDI